MIWLNDDTVFSVGFSSKNERQFKLWDLKNSSAPTQTHVIDTLTGVISPYFEQDSNLIYLPGRVLY